MVYANASQLKYCGIAGSDLTHKAFVLPEIH